MAGENGGGAFVLVYLISVLIIGFSIMLAEMLIGYLGKGDTVTSFENLAPEKNEKTLAFCRISSIYSTSHYVILLCGYWLDTQLCRTLILCSSFNV